MSNNKEPKKINRVLPRIRVVYTDGIVDVNNSDVNNIENNSDFIPAVFNRGDIKAIPHLVEVRGYIRKGVFHIEKWYNNKFTINEMIACN